MIDNDNGTDSRDRDRKKGVTIVAEINRTEDDEVASWQFQKQLMVSGILECEWF